MKVRITTLKTWSEKLMFPRVTNKWSEPIKKMKKDVNQSVTVRQLFMELPKDTQRN